MLVCLLWKLHVTICDKVKFKQKSIQHPIKVYAEGKYFVSDIIGQENG